ncbi:MAG TPA: DUF1572 family protein [Terriglobales bacterium]|nr:DUF1572 family protein [Terriglobales bacterium]
MAHEFTTDYLKDSIFIFRQYKKLTEKAIEQLSVGDLFRTIDPEANSIAVIMRHMAGNMRSRWTDFLTTDGEKPDRNRDQEFELPSGTSKEKLMEEWENGWTLVFAALEPLTEADLSRKVFIRQEPHSVMQAINRQIAHYADHVGQIVLLAKHFKSKDWKSLSIPKKGSAEFNAQMAQKDTK